MWRLLLAGTAQKDFRKLPLADQRRISRALQAMQADPFSGDVVRLKGEATAWRRRVGNYRIIYDLHMEDRLVVVSGILRRTSTTY